MEIDARFMREFTYAYMYLDLNSVRQLCVDNEWSGEGRERDFPRGRGEYMTDISARCRMHHTFFTRRVRW